MLTPPNQRVTATGQSYDRRSVASRAGGAMIMSNITPPTAKSRKAVLATSFPSMIHEIPQFHRPHEVNSTTSVTA
jgi:hypothetical protein